MNYKQVCKAKELMEKHGRSNGTASELLGKYVLVRCGLMGKQHRYRHRFLVDREGQVHSGE